MAAEGVAGLEREGESGCVEGCERERQDECGCGERDPVAHGQVPGQSGCNDCGRLASGRGAALAYVEKVCRGFGSGLEDYEQRVALCEWV